MTNIVVITDAYLLIAYSPIDSLPLLRLRCLQYDRCSGY